MRFKRLRLIYALALLERENMALRDEFDRSYRRCAATAHLHPDFRRNCSSCLGVVCAKMVQRGLNDDGQALPYKDRPTCGALIRIGAMCANRVIPGKTKCHMHGGKSTGPKTAAGKERVADAQRKRWALFRAQNAKS